MSSDVIENNITFTKPKDIANAFNKCFINILRLIQSIIKFSRKEFYGFFLDIEKLFSSIKPADKIEFK